MRSIFKIFALTFLTSLPAFSQQVNPTSQIRWSAAVGCGSLGLAYAPANAACIATGGANYGWQIQLGAAQTIGATTVTLISLTGVPSNGNFFVDGEYESYSGINVGALQLTGVARGLNNTAPAAHSNGAAAYSVDLQFQSTTHYPIGGIFGGQTLAFNNGFAVSGNPFTINSGSNEFDVLTNGSIVQQNGSDINYLSSVEIGVPSGRNDGTNYVLPINNTSQVVQDSAAHQLTLPFGTNSMAGPVISVPPLAVGAAALIPQFIGAGTCNITYVVTGVDRDGVEFPGTASSITGLAPWSSPASVKIRYPSAAGAVSYNGYRTAVSGGCTGLALGKFISGVTGNAAVGMGDVYTGGDSTTPPATNLSIAKQCVGSAANAELFCELAAAAPPSGACTTGWMFHNTVGTTATTHLYICEASAWVGVL